MASPLAEIARAARHLESFGVDPQSPTDVLCHTFESDRDKWGCWAAHSLMLAWKDLAAGEIRYAFRGLLQVKEYRGARGGFLPSHLSDSLTFLQNAIEEYIPRSI